METNFFSQLESMIKGFDLQISIKKKDGKLTVLVFSEPRIDDAAKEHIRPLNFVATGQELDQHFFSEIQKPLEKVAGWSVDMKDFENSVALAEAESQRAKKKAEEDRKKKADADKFLDKARKLIQEKKPSQAIVPIQEALKVHPEYEQAEKLLKEARNKAGFGEDLFSPPAAKPSTAEQQAEKSDSSDTSEEESSSADDSDDPDKDEKT